MDKVKRYIPLTRVFFNEIPEYLHSSLLYKELTEDNDLLEVKLININKINNTNELLQYIELFIYWMLDDYPDFFYDYLVENEISEEVINEIKDNLFNFDIIGLLEAIMVFKKENRYNGYCNLSFLKYIHLHWCIWDEETTRNAAKNGNLECLIYAHKNECKWNSNILFTDAAEGGHLEILKYLYENKCPWNKNITEIATKYGHLEILKYTIKNKFPLNKFLAYYAAKHGHLNCLIFVHENGCQIDKWTVKTAAKHGHLECLKYAIKNKCYQEDDDIIKITAKYGHLECLKYAYENNHSIINILEIIEQIIQYGHIDCLKFFIKKGYQLNEIAFKYATEYDQLECLKFLHENNYS